MIVGVRGSTEGIGSTVAAALEIGIGEPEAKADEEGLAWVEVSQPNARLAATSPASGANRLR